MKLKILPAIILAAWISTWCSKVDYQKEEIVVSIAEILEKRDILQEMTTNWDCEIIDYEQEATNGKVIVEWYRCNQDLDSNKISSEYAITISKYSNIYYWTKWETCNDIEIYYWKIDNKTPLMKWNKVLVNINWKEKNIDNINCKKLLKIIEV